MKDKNTGQILTSNNIKVHPRMKELYKFFKYNGKVMDIIDYDPDVLHIFSRDVLRRIASGEDGWQELLPEGVAELITENDLFKTAETLEPEAEEKS